MAALAPAGRRSASPTRRSTPTSSGVSAVRPPAVVPILIPAGESGATPAGRDELDRIVDRGTDRGRCSSSSGGISPNKAQHHLVEALWLYRRWYDPEARLHLVGPAVTGSYADAVFALADELGLTDAVRHGERPLRSRARRLVCRRRRVRLPVGARRVLHSVARGHARRPPHRGLCGRCGARDARRCGRSARLPNDRVWWPRPSTGSAADAALADRLVDAGHRRLDVFSSPRDPGQVRRGARPGGGAIGGPTDEAHLRDPPLRTRGHRRSGDRRPDAGRTPVPAAGVGGGGADQLRPRPPHVGEHRARRAPRV